MSKRPRVDDALALPDTASSSASVVDLQNVVRALQLMHSTSMALRKKLHCGETRASNVTEDSETQTMQGIHERLRANQVDSASRLLTDNLHTMISDLLATLCDDKKVRLCTLIDDVFVDVLMCLDRVSLDATQVTCVRFDTIVQKHLKNVCFRTLVMDISRGYQDEADINESDSTHGIYRMIIKAEAVVMISPNTVNYYRTFIFESPNLQDIIAKLEQKVPQATYMRNMELLGVPEVLPRISQSHPALAAKIVIGTAQIEEFEEDHVDALALLDQFDAFHAVNSLSCLDSSVRNANCEFFKRCREKGILDLWLCEHEDEMPAEGLLDFCFGPTREGLENVERRVNASVAFVGEELPRGMLEAFQTQGTPSHRILLILESYEGTSKLKDEVAKYYVRKKTVDKHEEQYATRPVDGVEVVWSFRCYGYCVTCSVRYV
ncbi:hypothetical protein AAVH_06648 [Aphelenchoides avenae]|nr:hypothetical protein AAVH_06648 [Aphelenchus avenae]